MATLVDTADAAGLETLSHQTDAIAGGYLGGQANPGHPAGKNPIPQTGGAVFTLFKDPAAQKTLSDLSDRLSAMLTREQALLAKQAGSLETQAVDVISRRIETLKDMIWCLDVELAGNIGRIQALMSGSADHGPDSRITVFRQINAVLNSIDRLEVRGRDSAGISILFIMPAEAYETFSAALDRKGLITEFERRMDRDVLGNTSISLNRSATDDGRPIVALTVVYKVAAEIGSLGDNVRFLRRQIQQDAILQQIAATPRAFHTVRPIPAGPRWAPSPNPTATRWTIPYPGATLKDRPIIHVCLNGDIDNYLELKAAMEASGRTHSRDDHHRHQDHPAADRALPAEPASTWPRPSGWRSMISKGPTPSPCIPTWPRGNSFWPRKGSGQAVFVGLAEDHYMPASEVYGFIEETPRYLKMNGEKVVEGKNGKTQGQIFILDQALIRRACRHQAMYYDGTPIQLTDDDVKHTEITIPGHRPPGLSPLFSQGDLRIAPVGGKNPPKPLEDCRRRREPALRHPSGRTDLSRLAGKRPCGKTGSGGSISSARAPPAWPPRPAPTSSNPI